MPAKGPIDSPDRALAELADLRRNLLTTFLLPLLVVPVLWLIHVTRSDWRSDTVDWAVLQMAPAIYAVLRLREKHHNWACWIFLLSLTLGLCLVFWTYPHILLLSYGVVMIVAAHALLGPGAAAGIGALAWAGMMATWFLLTGSLAEGGLVGLLYFLAWGATALLGRPLKTTIALTLSGWERAQDALADAQDRRAEIYRVARALEEATYRIERMNSELLMARHEAEEARAHKAWFVATVSHELRGPLNLILGYSRLLALSPERYGEPLPAAYRADIATIYRNSQHLTDLIDDILDLSQIEARRLPLVKERVELKRDVIEAALDTIRPLAERKGLYVRTELAEPLPVVLADQVRLRQVMINLLTNAVRFTERGGITVRVAQEGGELHISVRDTGAGIPAEELPRIFGEFYQVRAGEKPQKGTSGLGLAISKQLIELHGGRIWVESQKGVGTTFHFTVPLAEAQAISRAEVRTEESAYARSKAKTHILVHTDPNITRLLARHLDGYRVVGVAAAEDVLPLTQELHPRAIITSAQASQRLHQEVNAVFDVPIISWSLPEGVAQRGIEGILGYLIKPITPEMITMVINRIERDGEMTILIVDDDPDAVRLVELMLNALPRPYRILKAYDGQQALEVMQEHVPDLVLMDIVMPGLSGEEAVARMRQEETLRRVPVVFITAQDAFEGNMAPLGAPLQVHYRRPLTSEQGIKCLQALLEVLRPDYLPGPTAAAPSAATSLERSASATPPPPPGPGPSGVG